MNTITEKETIAIFKNLGFTEEVTSCDCCGKQDLKGTYAIEDLQNGGIMYLGCVCAANRMNWSKKEFVSKYKMEERVQTMAARSEFRDSEPVRAYNNWVNNLPSTETSEGWQKRMEILTSERPAYYAAMEAKKILLKVKYPLATLIF